MASVQQRRLVANASDEDVRLTINRLADVLYGNKGGRIDLFGDDGTVRELRGGLQLASNGSALNIQSGVGFHAEMLHSVTDAIVFKAQDSGVTASVLTVTGNATIGGTLGVTGASTFTGTGTFNGALVANGAVTLGDAAADVITITGTATFAQLATFTLGLTSAAAVTISAGNLVFGTTAQRITGDMSNGTLANRLAFQTSTANSASGLGVMPNGSGVGGSLVAYSTSNPDASARGILQATATAINLISTHAGASFLPLHLQTNSTSQIIIAANGDITIAPSGGKIGLFGATPVAQQTVAAAATDLASVITLANSIRTNLRTRGDFS